jgi:CRP/FNR family transcriptional regulator
MGLGMRGSYGFNAEAITPMELCAFPALQLRGLMEDYPRIRRFLQGLAEDEIQGHRQHMILLGRKTARERVASFLMDQSRLAERRGRAGNPIRLPMQRLDIADYLGLTIETVSRTLSAFKREGLIALDSGHRVRLKDAGTLSALAGGYMRA